MFQKHVDPVMGLGLGQIYPHIYLDAPESIFGRTLSSCQHNLLQSSYHGSAYFWNITMGSACKSLTSTFRPASKTALFFLTNNQPMCEKNQPRFESCGSAAVSEWR